MQATVVAMMNEEESLNARMVELESEDIGLRWRAAMALSKMGTPVLDPLLECIQNGSVAKAPAMWAISEIGHKKAVPVLVNELFLGEEEFHRAMAACALLKIADPEGVEQVKMALANGTEAFAELFMEVYGK